MVQSWLFFSNSPMSNSR